MLLLMLWTQKFEFGKLVAGVAYDMKGREAVANDLIKRDMARKVSKEELAELNAQVVSLDPSLSNSADDAKATADAEATPDATAAADAKAAEAGGKK